MTSGTFCIGWWYETSGQGLQCHSVEVESVPSLTCTTAGAAFRPLQDMLRHQILPACCML